MRVATLKIVYDEKKEGAIEEWDLVELLGLYDDGETVEVVTDEETK